MKAFKTRNRHFVKDFNSTPKLVDLTTTPATLLAGTLLILDP